MAPVLIRATQPLRVFAAFVMGTDQGPIGCFLLQVLQVLLVEVAIPFGGATVDEGPVCI